MIPADCVWAAVRHPGPAPAGAQYGAIDKRFVGLQTLQGRTYKEIVDIVGAPMTNNKHPESGHRIAIWGKTGLFNIWQVGLQFDRYDVCLGIFSEFNA